MNDRRIDIFNLLKQEDKLTKVLAFVAKTSVADPYEKNEVKVYNQSVVIDALIRDISPESVYYKYFGQIPIGSKELICERKHITTIKAADRIKIEDNYFKVRKDDVRGWSILQRKDYIVVILELKSINA